MESRVPRETRPRPNRCPCECSSSFDAGIAWLRHPGVLPRISLRACTRSMSAFFHSHRRCEICSAGRSNAAVYARTFVHFVKRQQRERAGVSFAAPVCTSLLCIGELHVVAPVRCRHRCSRNNHHVLLAGAKARVSHFNGCHHLQSQHKSIPHRLCTCALSSILLHALFTLLPDSTLLRRSTVDKTRRPHRVGFTPASKPQTSGGNGCNLVLYQPLESMGMLRHQNIGDV